MSSKAWLRSASSSSSWLFGCTPESPPEVHLGRFCDCSDQYLGSKVLWHRFEEREVVHVKFLSSWVAFLENKRMQQTTEHTQQLAKETAIHLMEKNSKDSRLPVHNSRVSEKLLPETEMCSFHGSVDPNRDCDADLKRDTWCGAWRDSHFFYFQTRRWCEKKGQERGIENVTRECCLQQIHPYQHVTSSLCRLWAALVKSFVAHGKLQQSTSGTLSC